MGKTSFMVLVVLCALAGGPLKLCAQARTLPLFEIKLNTGKSLRSEDLKGKVAVIDFWGTWCKPCLVEIPEYNALFRDYGSKGLVFVAVAVESGTDKELAAAAKRLNIEYPVAPATADQLDAFGQVLVFPTTWVFDREGRLVKEFLGTPATKHRELRSLVDSLLAAP
jgi:thiol-disulfide isomerase/thioredoxin